MDSAITHAENFNTGTRPIRSDSRPAKMRVDALASVNMAKNIPLFAICKLSLKSGTKVSNTP